MPGEAPNRSNAVVGEQPGVADSRVMANSREADIARASVLRAKRIAVVSKFRFMGDTVVATPFLGQLRRQTPDSEIDLYAAPSVVTALANCPHVDRMIPVDASRTNRLRHAKELYSSLRKGGYDVAFVLNRSLQCAVTIAFSGIPVRIGYANEFRKSLLTVPIPYFFDRNEIDCHLDMLRSIGLSAKDALPDLWVTEAERAQANEILRANGWDGNQLLIGIQPGANDPEIREWGSDRFARVATILAEEMSASVVLMGGSEERGAADQVSGAMQAAPINLAGQLSLREALAVTGMCRLWLGNDTGLLHCAVAQRVASVGIFGPNKVVRWGYDAPRHRSMVVFPDSPALNDQAVRRALDAVTEEDVLTAAREVLNAKDCATPDDGCGSSRAPYYAATLRPEQLVPAPRR